VRGSASSCPGRLRSRLAYPRPGSLRVPARTAFHLERRWNRVPMQAWFALSACVLLSCEGAKDSKQATIISVGGLYDPYYVNGRGDTGACLTPIHLLPIKPPLERGQEPLPDMLISHVPGATSVDVNWEPHGLWKDVPLNADGSFALSRNPQDPLGGSPYLGKFLREGLMLHHFPFGLGALQVGACIEARRFEGANEIPEHPPKR
jgi:hypothetical protein